MAGVATWGGLSWAFGARVYIELRRAWPLGREREIGTCLFLLIQDGTIRLANQPGRAQEAMDSHARTSSPCVCHASAIAGFRMSYERTESSQRIHDIFLCFFNINERTIRELPTVKEIRLVGPTCGIWVLAKQNKINKTTKFSHWYFDRVNAKQK